MKKKLLLILLILPYCFSADAQSKYFTESFETSAVSSSIYSTATDVNLPSGTWNIFRASRQGTTAACSPQVGLKALKMETDGVFISPKLDYGVSSVSFTEGKKQSRKIIVSTSSDNGATWDAGTEFTTSTVNCGDVSTLTIASGASINRIKFTCPNNTSQAYLDSLSVFSDITLPLDFVSLAGKADALGKTVGLNWSTTNEVNTKNFEIQKRTDATSFVTIGSLASKNTAGIHAYSFTDQSASSGTAYYRVLQFDNDGSSKSSSVIAVTSKTATKLSIYPNPAEQTLNVNHPLSSNKANFSVLSLDGKIMLKKAVAANSTSSMLDVSSLASGAYMVILEDQNQKSSIKFIKK